MTPTEIEKLEAALYALVNHKTCIATPDPIEASIFGEVIEEAARAHLQTLKSGDVEADISKAIHYPECWDTAAYPNLIFALAELFAWFKCSNEDCTTPPVDGDKIREALKECPWIETVDEYISVKEHSRLVYMWWLQHGESIRALLTNSASGGK